ncbi:thymidylate kinase-like [Haliotis rubra]|uniref:thymidylate kinase-like n=1 Tax=Haliotis rubra TaxID=36100 RepID=UPI001EE580F8|nr:thymidylate kinase-like [Haliotis rubra]XP_046553284.1 thymidylate kinase-like [Haliotis rubra]XP_046553285.1 thymidylate kinase-like [Haliotis rubra]XP_046553286.1 thymidylate kinase-like [Haliotis rubra]
MIRFWRLIRNRRTFSSTMKDRGALVVFEGCDRCGKTTQCNQLLQKLTADGIPAKLMKFPDRTTVIGQMINEYLQKKAELDDHAVHLLFSANRWERVKDIYQLLSEGTTLIVDRYAFSGVAFTASKKGFSLDWCKQPDVGLPCPDKVLYLTLTPEAAGKRAGFGGERYEQKDFQKRVAENFEKLQDENWQRIDADRSIEDLHCELYAIVKQTIQEARNKTIEKLWVET